MPPAAIESLCFNERSKRRLRGTCELSGHKLAISLERPDAGSGPAALELRHASGNLPPALLAIVAVILADHSCPVQAVRAGGEQALQGQVPAAVADLQFLPPAPAAPEPEPAPRPESANQAPPAPGAAPDSLEDLLGLYRSAKERLEGAAAKSVAARDRIAAAERELEAARRGLADIEGGANAARSEAADLGARLREAVEREVS